MDDLVRQDQPRSSYFLGVAHLVAGAGFEPGHKPDAPLVQAVEPGIVQISPVKDQQITGVEVQLLHHGAIVGFTVGEDHALRQHIGQHCMELNGPLAGPKLGPGEDAGAEINGGGVNDLDLRAVLVIPVQVGGDSFQELIVQLFKNQGRPVFVGLRQGGTLHRREAQMIQFADLPVQAKHQVPHALASAPLTEEHGYQMGPVGEGSRFWSLPVMAVHQVGENMSRYKL